MRLLVVSVVISLCYFDGLCLPAKPNQSSSCTLKCAKLPKSEQAGCNCYDPDDVSSGIVKRDTVQELIAKANKRRKVNLLEPKKFELNKKLHLQPKASINPTQHHSVAYKELQDRLKDFKTKMSGKSLLKSRANFQDDKPNLMEKFKSKQEELMEKVRNANAKAQLKTNAVRENLQDRTELKLKSRLGESNLLGATTETPPKSSTVLVLVTSSTTTPTSLINDVNSNNNDKTIPKAIDRIKEKQKEAVTKIKDKISLSKIGKPDNMETTS